MCPHLGFLGVRISDHNCNTIQILDSCLSVIRMIGMSEDRMILLYFSFTSISESKSCYVLFLNYSFAILSKMVPAPIFKMANELAKTKPVKLKNTFKMTCIFYCTMMTCTNCFTVRPLHLHCGLN